MGAAVQRGWAGYPHGGGVTICIWNVIGLAGSLALAQTASSLLFGISARDPGQLGAAAAALSAAAALGSLLPARRASRIDPMNALRDE